MKPPGQFDHDYANAIQDACLRAILEASIDPATNTAVLRNSEITKALLMLMAMLAATSDEASSPTKIRHLAEDFAKDFRQLVTANMDKNGGPPFPVIHPKDRQ